jgi:hypothetical protein
MDMSEEGGAASMTIVAKTDGEKARDIHREYNTAGGVARRKDDKRGSLRSHANYAI